MSSGARIGLLAGTVVVLALAFVLLSPGDDDDGSDTGNAPTATAPATTTPAQTTTAEPEPEPDAPEFESIRVRDAKPVGGVQTITVEKGERARIQISSPDTTDEIHLHGYDLTRGLQAGGSVRFSFDADAEGVFEIELEGAHTQIGKLVVEP